MRRWGGSSARRPPGGPVATLVAVVLGLGLVAAATGCTGGPASAPATPSGEALAAGGTPERPAALVVEVHERRPHDPEAYTQGLELHGPLLLESTGQYGRSTLREVDPTTGAVQREVALDDALFGEGLTLVGDRLIQLTWKEGVALVYDPATFEQVDEHRYDGQGWGLCLDDDRLVMSDGSDRLTFRDPETFAPTGSVDVTLAGQPLPALNELECVGGHVYANVYQTAQIVQIDPASGAVVATVDASALLEPEEARHAGVLNGIAYDPAAQAFLITGKLWPTLFVVSFVPA